MRNTALILIFIILGITKIEAQYDPVTLDIKLPSTVKILGTSTLHDWESNVEKTNAIIAFDNYQDITIETLRVLVDVYSIKSGKKTMDKLTYKALKAEEHPIIRFLFKEGKIVDQDEDFININLNGDLTIAGITKNVTVLTKINKNGDSIVLTGTHKLKMTTYGIKPPKALLGTIKTGDEITIEFSLKF